MTRAGLETTMIRTARSSGLVRAVLCAAALLSVMGAFGLHPEPAGLAEAPAGARLSTRASALPAPHDCVACLKAANALVAAPAGIVPVASESGPASSDRVAPVPARLFEGRLSGRSPPAAASF
jgi:hypothetical protein